MLVLSKMETIPRDVLERIVLSAVELPYLGPPSALIPFLCLSHTISKTLHKDHNPHLYARIFRRKFDVRAAARRLGNDSTYAHALANELVRRCEGLKRLRCNAYPRHTHGDTFDGGLRVDLWMAYLMLMENDGKNAQQLQYARIDRLALDFVRPGGRLHDGAEGNEGWTVESEVNALGVWLFWFTDDERVQSETAASREEILAALGCLFVGSFKYACTHAPLTSFLIPPDIPPRPTPSGSIFPLSATPIYPPCTVPNHFGRELTLARPLLPPPALLGYLIRLRGYDAGLPAGLSAATPPEAMTARWLGAQGAGFSRSERQGKGSVEWKEKGSLRHEHDWMRLLTCYDPWSKPQKRNRVFTPGMLNGVWEGRWLTIPPDVFRSIIQTAEAHDPVLTPLEPDVFQQPMQFRFLEHHQHDRDSVVEVHDISSDGVGEGALRAWLPERAEGVEREGHLDVYDPIKKKTSTYRTYDPAQVALDEELPLDVGPYGGGVWDIILTAETEEEFSQVWGHDRYLGRVREWDGLIVLVRELRPNSGCWVYRGYVHGNQNLVGRWRETGTPVDEAGWEGVWGMVKRHA